MTLRPRHPALLLLSLVAAFVLWNSVARERREHISVRGVRASLTLVNIPRELVITSSVPETVSVQLRGPLSRALDARSPVEVLLDLSSARPGMQTFPIEDRDIQVPPEVEVVSVEPAEITFELERLETAVLPIRPLLDGSPAPGFVVGQVRVAPAQVTVQGPGSLLAALDSVETTPVLVEGATTEVDLAVQARLPHPLLRTVTAVPLLVVVEIVPEPQPQLTPTPSARRRRPPG
jgi:YbbR domain-containing protein